MTIQNDLERIAKAAETNSILAYTKGYQDVSDAWANVAKSIDDCIERIKPDLKLAGEISELENSLKDADKSG